MLERQEYEDFARRFYQPHTQQLIRKEAVPGSAVWSPEQAKLDWLLNTLRATEEAQPVFNEPGTQAKFNNLLYVVRFYTGTTPPRLMDQEIRFAKEEDVWYLHENFR